MTCARRRGWVVAGALALVVSPAGRPRAEGPPRPVSELQGPATGHQSVDPDVLQNLDLLLNLEVLESMEVMEQYEVTRDTTSTTP